MYIGLSKLRSIKHNLIIILIKKKVIDTFSFSVQVHFIEKSYTIFVRDQQTLVGSKIYLNIVQYRVFTQKLESFPPYL